MNIMDEYIKLTKKCITEYMKLIFMNKFDKQVYNAYLETYIEVRYYNLNESSNTLKNKILEALNEKKEQLIELLSPKKQKSIDDILLIFTNILYLDDVIQIKSIEKVIDDIYDLRLEIIGQNNEDFKEQFYQIFCESIKQKEELLKVAESKEFHLKLTRYKGISNVQRVNLKYDFKLPLIYSNLAIEKAFNTGTTNEDKLFVEYYMITVQAINDIIKGNFRKQYIVEFSDTLFEKEQKITRLLNIINNPVIQEKLSIKVRYKTFLQNKEKIYKLMRDGYKVAIILDETFEINLQEIGKLNIFSYILVNRNSDYYKEITKNRKYLKNIIEL